MNPGIAIHQTIREFIHQSEEFTITSHSRPDGDAIGAILAMGLSLRKLGKKAQMVLMDGVPSNLRFISGTEEILLKAMEPVGSLVVLDSSDQQRIAAELHGTSPHLNIDHHVTNSHFAEINFVEADAVATCEILANSMPGWNLPFDQQIASALLSGIVTDTIGFRTSNVTPRTFRITADLIGLGTDLSTIYHHTLDTRSFQAARYWGKGLENLQKEDRIIWSALTLQNRESAKYFGNDDADLINLLSTIEEADIFIMFIEQKHAHVKVSWRANPGWDVSQIALYFGGGGHSAASGAEINGMLDEVVRLVLGETKKIRKTERCD